MGQNSSIRHLPYGQSDFATIRKENRYYVDKTMFIPALEVYKYQTFLRPRRFGKSLMLNMLAAYYDVAMKDDFDMLFGDLYIGKNPTKNRNKYLILRFDFSKVDPDPTNLNKSFNDLVLATLRDFAEKYENILREGAVEEIKSQKQSNTAFTELLNIVKRSGREGYAIIDEYDNFANTMLADSETNYKNLTHGNVFFRLFFNNLKATTNDNNAPVARIMISGVTPLTLSDVTSGYNIGTNISTDFHFNTLAGFTKTEFRQMLEYYRDATGIFKHSVDELIEITKPWYDNNCFSTKALKQDRMYNSDMALYFLRVYIGNDGELPETMVDSNINTDYNKMAKLIRLEKQFGQKTSLIQRIMTEGEIYSNIKPEFSLDDLTRYENLVSLMFYMGLLSVGGYEKARTLLIIPNSTVRQQYFEYMKNSYDKLISWKTDDNIMNDLGYNFAWNGEHEPFMRYIASCMKETSDNGDVIKTGEAFVKGFILGQFGTNLNYYLAHTEYAHGHCYSDIFLEPRRGTPYAYVIVLKYCPKSSDEKDFEKLLDEARTQLPQYVNNHKINVQAKDNGWTLTGIIMVFNGWELARYEVVEN
ncbi:MAG: AAA family ATPase [Bacteroidales bacterium]|nr:AAA family ATPase [Bacteroidales bacterium]